ncbi:MAG TPA: IPT/TIG domain-containing protein, partial [Terriglobales bacterium]|nr:IPT/TIG domain-containing protein [Terriglobales bacterium]
MKTVLALTLAALCLGCGYGTAKSNTPSAGTTPNISALVPNNVNANSAAFVLTVNGTSFNNNAQVMWNGAGQTTTFVTANQLTVNVP